MMAKMFDIESEWHALLFGVRRSVRYHDRRIKFFDHMRKVISILTLLSGSGAIITAISPLGTAYVIVASAIVAILSAIDLIFDPAGYARAHNDLKRHFIALEGDMTLAEETQENIKNFISKRLGIEAEEPPVLRVLDIICHNEVLRSMGYDEAEFEHLSLIQRFFANYVDINADSIGRPSVR